MKPLNCRRFVTVAISLLFIGHRGLAHAASPEHTDSTPRTLNTPREFPTLNSLSEWRARARSIREQILVSSGLWPMPPKTPLHPVIFGKIERDGYSVEKVYIETLPGFYLAGNLYRPLGHGKGPFPAILNPHGHWSEGRLADSTNGSIAARCISFARQGMIAFSYDMLGYNDTHFADKGTNKPNYDLHRQFGTNRSDQLWNIGPMGLQTWNSIRALDFLELLPETDHKRLACTGESGGGTQTFMLGAVDDRLAVQAPVVMVSHTMQGGCACENAPGLRLEFSNMEIAAAAAPRPQILVAASGDWTKTTMTVEGPAVEGIYRLFNAGDKISYVRFDFGHNYNQTSREAVYEWFGKFLIPNTTGIALKEAAYQKEPDSALRVFPAGKLPAKAASQEQVIAYLKRTRQDLWESLIPNNQTSLKRYKETMMPSWRHTLQVEWPPRTLEPQLEESRKSPTFSSAILKLPTGDGTTYQAQFFVPASIATNKNPKLVVLNAERSTGNPPSFREDLASSLLRHGLAVVVIKQSPTDLPPDQTSIFYTAYNRTRCQERVRELVDFCAMAAKPASSLGVSEPFHVILAGTGRAGLWALLAAPAADAVIADCDGLDVGDDGAMLSPDLFCPGIRNLGSFAGAAMTAAPHPLALHNVGRQFPFENIRKVYKAIGANDKFHVETTPLTAEHIALLAAGM